MSSMAAHAHPLLGPGHETDWAAINRSEAEDERRAARALTMAQRLELGQQLSNQAVAFLAAARRAGLGPRRGAAV